MAPRWFGGTTLPPRGIWLIVHALDAGPVSLHHCGVAHQTSLRSPRTRRVRCWSRGITSAGCTRRYGSPPRCRLGSLTAHGPSRRSWQHRFSPVPKGYAMAKRKAARTTRRKTVGKRAGARRARSAARKTAPRTRAARKTAKKSSGATARQAARKRLGRKTAARKATARRAPARKAPSRKATARQAPTAKTKAPKSLPALQAPALNRARRTVQDDDLVRTPPSSLDLDHTASAARTGEGEGDRDQADRPSSLVTTPPTETTT